MLESDTSCAGLPALGYRGYDLNIVDSILVFLDPALVGPYRLIESWSGHPMAAWWAGTFVLALWAVALGHATIYLARVINGSFLEQSSAEARELSNKSMDALKSGDKEAYKAINSLATDSFGKSFFQQVAVSAGSLWPAFLGAAWLEARFGDIRFAVPWMENGINFVPPYLICYIAARIIWGRAKRTFVTSVHPEMR